ncbi:MAG: hypothetical protein IKT40_12225 [Bacilli bacterium]|nr:hypothetical protein [Bacilli bacterium]
MKKVVRLTEEDIKNMIKESVNSILKEYYGNEDGFYDYENDAMDQADSNHDMMTDDYLGNKKEIDNNEEQPF